MSYQIKLYLGLWSALQCLCPTHHAIEPFDLQLILLQHLVPETGNIWEYDPVEVLERGV